jgi:hypothetical protein
MVDRENSSSAESGYSVVEGLIAAALLLIVTVGILPLFARSMANNVSGNDQTRQSNGAVDEFERSTSLPFNSGDMSLLLGNDRVDDTVIALKKLSVSPGEPDTVMSTRWELPANLGTDDLQQTVRRRRLRQFPFDEFNATTPGASFQNPLPQGTPDSAVIFKVVDVTIFDADNDPLAQLPSTYRLRLIETY